MFHAARPLHNEWSVGLDSWLQKPGKRVVTEALALGKERLFGKRVRLETLAKRLRISRGKPKSEGLFDWPVEELVNVAEASYRKARIAGLVAFGFTRSRLGLVSDIFMLFELLEDHLDGLQWLSRNPTRINELLAQAFALIAALQQKGIQHMDLWVGNIMLPHDASLPAKAVDLENCFTQPTECLSEILAFQFGFLYFRHVYRYITEVEYDRLVRAELGRYSIDSKRFEMVYARAKHEPIGRYERRALFNG